MVVNEILLPFYFSFKQTLGLEVHTGCLAYSVLLFREIFL